MVSYFLSSSPSESIQNEFLPSLKLLIKYHHSKAMADTSHCKVLHSHLDSVSQNLSKANSASQGGDRDGSDRGSVSCKTAQRALGLPVQQGRYDIAQPKRNESHHLLVPRSMAVSRRVSRSLKHLSPLTDELMQSAQGSAHGAWHNGGTLLEDNSQVATEETNGPAVVPQKPYGNQSNSTFVQVVSDAAK